jgi:hypothetical protein
LSTAHEAVRLSTDQHRAPLWQAAGIESRAVDAELAGIAARQGGFFFRRQALACRYTEPEIAARLHTGAWGKVRHGAYATREVVAALDDGGRHVLTVRAAVASLTGRVVVTGHSALAVMNVPLWGVDLDEVHVHREDGKTSRREAGIAHHVGELPESEIVEIDGLLLARPERIAFDACRTSDFEAGVVMVDGLRRRGPFDVERAKALIEAHRDHAGSIRASRVVHFSRARAATVGESRARVLMARIGLPEPQLQHHVTDASGALIGITDFYFEEFGTVAEFDGKLKYGRALYERSGRIEDVDLGDVVWQEKRREDSIRDQGDEVVRLVWFELDGHDRQVTERFRRAFRRSRRGLEAG